MSGGLRTAGRTLGDLLAGVEWAFDPREEAPSLLLPSAVWFATFPWHGAGAAPTDGDGAATVPAPPPAVTAPD